MALKVLVVEENESDFYLIESCLERHGLAAHCRRVTSPGELEAALDEGGWNAVLSEYGVPNLDIEGTLKLVQGRDADVPLIVVSGGLSEEKAVELLKLGVWDVVFKDRMVRLAPVLERCLRDASERLGRHSPEASVLVMGKEYREILEGYPDAIIISEPPSWRFTFGNPAALKIFGIRDQAEFFSLGPLELSPERQPDGRESAEKAKEMIETAVREGSHLFEWMHRRTNGEEFPAEVLLTRIEQGERAVLLGTVRDITRRARVEKALQESESRFRTLIEQAPVAIGISRKGIGIYANEKFLQTFGLRGVEEYIGHPLIELFAPQCREAIGERIRRRSLGLPEPSDYETIGLRADGSTFPMHIAISQVKLADGMANVGFIRDITERERVTQALEKSNSLLNATLESTADGILVIDGERNVASYNQKFLELWRIPTAVAAKRDDREMLHCVLDQLEDPEAFLAKVEELYRNPQDSLWDELKFRDGRVLDRYTQPQRLGGAVVGRVWSFRDITERKRAEEALHQTNVRVRHLNSVLRAIQEISILLSREKNPTNLLSALCQSLVKTRGYVTVWVGRPDAETKHVLPLAHAGAGGTAFLEHAPITWDESPSGQGPTGAAIRELRAVVFNDILHDARFAPWRDVVAASGGASVASIPILHDGRLFGALTIKADQPNAFDEEEVAHLSGLAADVGRALRNIEDETARRTAEEARVRLATAVEQSGETIVITDIYGTILYANPVFEKSTGYTCAEALGKNPRILKSGRHDEEFYRRMWETLKRGEVWSGHFFNRRKDGTLYEEDATISPVRDTRGEIVNFVAVKRDITHEMQLEAQLREAQKMEAIGQLAGGVAHDFNNILAAILMQSELDAMTENIPDNVRVGLREISSYAERAASLTRQLLLFSRRQVMQARDLELNDLVTSLVKMLRRIIGEDVGMQLNLHPKALRTHGDSGMLDQVLLNLVVNARDAMPGGGRITIETGEKFFTPGEAALIPDASPGRKVCLRVIDTGSGIGPENLVRIFEPFFTTKEPGKGTGLGLATVFGIVKQHGGWLTVKSEVGRGATFEAFFPAIETTVKLPDEAEAGPKPPGGTETILLVEDEEPVRILIRTMLERAGYKVLEAADGVEAERIWEENREAIELLLTDIVMPEGVSGRDLAARLQGRRTGLRVIFTSGYSAEIAGRELSLKRGQNFIMKPFSTQELLETVRQSLDG